MKNRWVFVAALLIVVGLVLYMISFTVPYNQSAVVLNFGAANAPINADGESAGFNWKMPYPMQKVEYYDRRINVLDTNVNETKLKDGHAVTRNAYLVWRISDPLAFRESHRSKANAEDNLRVKLNSALRVLDSYSLTELTNAQTSVSKFDEAEKAMLEELKASSENDGIEILTAGITRLSFNAALSTTVFDKMRTGMEEAAFEATSSGQSEATRLRSDAELAKSEIENFARLYAQQIRSQGDRIAAAYYEKFQADPEFAIFLRKIDSMKNIFEKGRTTIILGKDQEPIDLLYGIEQDEKE